MKIIKKVLKKMIYGIALIPISLYRLAAFAFASVIIFCAAVAMKIAGKKKPESDNEKPD